MKAMKDSDVRPEPARMRGESAATSRSEPAGPVLAGVMKAPCKSCPYRQDVPSGVWAPDEYEKLPGYDGEIVDQLQVGAVGLFMCHQQDGNLCAGWLAAHGPHNLLALRLHGGRVAGEVWDYRSPVPVFRCGAEAAAHGLAGVIEPGLRARRTIDRLVRAAERRPLHAPPASPAERQGLSPGKRQETSVNPTHRADQ